MKRFVSTLIIIVSCMYVCHAADSDLFTQANTLYKQGRFQAAQETYEKITEKSSRVFYNLGNCYYKQDKYGYALLYWRKAEHDWGLFNRAELLRNIALVKKVAAGGVDPKEINPLQKLIIEAKNAKAALVSLVRSTPLLFLQILFLIIWILIFSTLRFLHRKKLRIVMVGLFMLFVVSASALAVKYGLSFRQYGVMVQKGSLLSGPGEGYQTLGSIAEAQEVVIQKTSGEYCKIKVHGQIGWMHHKFVKEV